MATPESDQPDRTDNEDRVNTAEAKSPAEESSSAGGAESAKAPVDNASSSSTSAEGEKDALSSMLSAVAAAGQTDTDKTPKAEGKIEASDSPPAGDSQAAADKPAERPINLSESQQLHQHHVSKILDEVLDEPDDSQTPGRIRHPMVLDILLAVSLLFAMGGFTAGLFKMYIAHSAQQSIMQHNYKAAIAILKGAPLPGFIAIPGGSPDSDPQELLNQALYLDGMEKLDSKTDVNGGLNELQQIQAGSRFFTLAQEAINENFEPSSTLLKMGVEHEEKNPSPEKKPFVPEYPKDATP